MTDTAQLTLVGGGRSWHVESASVVVGRDPGCDIVLDSPAVSRQHLQIWRSGSGWQATDLQSSNGTFQNGHRVTSLSLAGHVELVLGGEDGIAITISPPIAMAQVTKAVPLSPAHTFEDLLDVAPGATVALPARQSTETRITIGRDPTNKLVLDDLQVSRHHAEVEAVADGQIILRDLRSSNGTFVDGVRIDEARITNRSIVSIGATTLVVADGEIRVLEDRGDLAFDVQNLLVLDRSGRPILNDVTVSIPPRTLVGVLGPSGAGKSTFVKAIVGAIPAGGGQVLYGGVDILSGLESMRRSIGYVPQDDILHDSLTVTQSLGYAARLRLPSDVSQEEVDGAVLEVLGKLGLLDHTSKLVSQLSGGQRKRVSTAMELLTEPPLLLLDEPSSGLDPGNEKILMGLLRDLAKADNDGSPGRRVVVVTHSVQSLSQCDYLLVLKPGTQGNPGGQLAYFGSPDELLESFGVSDPADVFTLLERGESVPTAANRVSGVGPVAQFGAPPEQVSSTLSWVQQLSLLTRRYARIVATDRQNLYLLAAQAPVIGILLAMVSGGAFEADEGVPSSGVVLLLLGLVLSITYLGTSNSVREIVKERPILLRERSLGLRLSAYVLSKFVVLAVLTILQAVALVGIGTLSAGSGLVPDGLGPIPNVRIGLVLVMISAGLAAVTLGLLISSLVTNADKAMSLLPVVLLALYFLSNGPAKLDGVPVVSQVSYLNSVRWGLADSAIVSNADRLLNCSPEGVEPDPFQAERCRPSWRPDGSRLAIGMTASTALAVACAAGAVGVLSRRRF